MNELEKARQDYDTACQRATGIDNRLGQIMHHIVALRSAINECQDASEMIRMKQGLADAESSYEALSRQAVRAHQEAQLAKERLKQALDAPRQRLADLQELRRRLHSCAVLLQEHETQVQAARRALSSAEGRLAATQHGHQSLAAHLAALEREEPAARAA
jgi:chromosome segregation ATPase